MPRRIYEKWIDRTAEGTALGLARECSIVHAGWQIGPGGYAANGVTTQVAAELPAGTLRLFSTSVGVWAMVVTGGNLKLYLSADGIAAYNLKLTTACGRMHATLPLLVDCGSNRLLVFEYSTDQVPQTNNTNRIWASTDGGENWSTLLTTAAGSIRHFHGGIYDATYSTLYVFTGDTGNQDSVCLCADVADLLANPNTWKTRWGLADGTRSTISASYVVGYGNEIYRCVGAIPHGDRIVTGNDVYWVAGGAQLSAWNRTTYRMGKIPVDAHSPIATNGNGLGELWTFGQTANGIILIGTSAHTMAESEFGDDCVHIYALHPSGLTAHEILRIPRTIAGSALPYSIHNVGGYTVISPNASTVSPRVGFVRMTPRAMVSPVTLTPRKDRRPGVAHPTHLLKEDGAALLLESDTGTNTALILGE